MHLPFHHYFGPGTDLSTAEQPVDVDDTIAALHDSKYESAISPQDIRRADLDAINHFSSDFLSTGNLHSALGTLGLGAKYLTESITGVLYPDKSTFAAKSETQSGSLGGNNMDVDSQPGPSAEKRKIGDDDDGTPKRSKRTIGSDKVGAPGMGGSIGGAGSVDAPVGQDYQEQTYVFKHKHLLYTRAWAGSEFEWGVGRVYTTSLCRIPTDCLPTYITPAEYAALPENCTVKKVLIKITPLGFRTPFIAGSADLAYTNSNSLVFYTYGLGLNNKFGGTNLNVDTASSKNPMLPGSVLPAAEGTETLKFWGFKPEDDTFKNSEVPTCAGNIQELRTVYCHYFANKAVDPNKTWPMVADDMRFGILSNDVPNAPIVYEYRPQVNAFKCTRVYAPVFNTDAEINFLLGNRVMSRFTPQYTQTTATDGKVKKLFADSELKEHYLEEELDYFSTIEMAGTVTHGMTEPAGGLIPPSFHIGVQPIHAFTNKPDEVSWQSLFAYWHMETEIVIESNVSSLRSLALYKHPNSFLSSTDKKMWISALQPMEYAFGKRATWTSIVNPTLGGFSKNNPDMVALNPSLEFTPNKPHMIDKEKFKKQSDAYTGTTSAPVTAKP